MSELKAGSVFVEFYVEDLAYYARLFCDALGFSVERDESDFMELRSAGAVVLLNGFADLGDGHPFDGFRARNDRGFGIEIGVVVADLLAAHTAALQVEDCSVTGIVARDWGMTDFRILTPHGYYLRVTTPYLPPT